MGGNLKPGQSADGIQWVKLRVATHYKKNIKDGQPVSQTDWHDVVAWNNTAAFAQKNFVKGSRIMVEGSIVYRTFLDKSGDKRYITQIKAHSLMNLDR